MTGMKTAKNRTQRLIIMLIVMFIAVQCFSVVYFILKQSGKASQKPLKVNCTMSHTAEFRNFEQSVRNKTASLPHTIPFSFNKPASDIEPVPAVFFNETDTIVTISCDNPEIAVGERDLFMPERFNFYEDTKPVRIPHNRCNMREELISLDDLDYGRYGAMITRDDADKRNIGGFLHIAATWGQQLRIPDTLKRSVINLAEAVTRYTAIRVGLDSHLMLDSHRLHSAPFVFITTDRAFELTPGRTAKFWRISP